jgi:hypothetical protein
MDINKKLIDQLSDLSRNIKSLTSEVKENNVVNTSDNPNSQKESPSDQNGNFLKSLESIFKKNIGEITKTNLKSSETLKNVIGGSKLKDTFLNQNPENEKTKGLKLPKDFGTFIEKIPKFEKGGTMDKKGFAIVGEKGPELLNLNRGDEIIPGNKILKEKNKLGSDAIKSILDAENSSINTSDQNLNSPNKKNSESSLEDIKFKLLQKDLGYYMNSPKKLEEDANKELDNLNKEKEGFTKENLQKLNKEKEGFTKENLQKLNKPKNPVENINTENENLSPREQRRKEKEEKNKNAEDLLKTKPEKSEKKEILNKSKNFLLSQGKDILTGKKSLADIGKDASSLLGDKSELVKKATGKASSLLTNKEFREKNIEKLKGLSNKKKEEKSSMNTESSELKRPKAEPKKEEVKETTETKETPKKETPKTETPKTETPKQETPKIETPKKSDSGSKESIKSSDLDTIKALLGKMVSLLEGPLYVESMESPFRPDSRRF